MASAAPRLSPESITVRMPRARRAASACFAPGLASSPNAISASSVKPVGLRSASAETVAPSTRNCVTCTSMSPKATPSSFIQRKLPISSCRPPTVPSTPRPGTARTCSGSINATALFFAAANTARANRCSLPLCKLAARASTCVSSSSPPRPGASIRAVICGCPTVRVPVLSNTTVSTRCATSSASASLIKMPCLAATPVPAMMAVGVASPSAQGQAITSTATA